MREFPLTITEPFVQGLRPEREVTGHTRYLTECYNMRPTEAGLEDYISPEDPFSGGVSTSWPWPQIFLLEGEDILAKETDIESISTGVSPWTLSGIDTYDPQNPGNTKSIPSGGGVWHVADLGEAWYMFKGNATVFKTGLHRIDGSSEKYYIDDTTTIQTGTTHKGRIIVGGFDNANLFNSTWTGIFSSFQADAASGIDFSFDDIDDNWVMWSSVGGGDIPLWLFYPDDNTFDIQLDEENLLKRLRRNEMGWMPMPFQGKVLKLATLGEALIVYGENGIAAMQLTAAQNIPDIGDPVPSTYGIRQISRFGIAGRGAVAEGRGAHFFLAENGEACVLNSDLQVQRLGYQEYLGNIASGTMTSQWNPEQEEFYICSDQEGFVFTGSGLAEHKDHITGGSYLGGTFYGLSHSPGTSDIEVVSNDVQMRLQARKRIDNVQVNARDIDSLTLSLLYRYERDDSYKELGPQGTNKEGVAHLRAAGLSFRLKIEGSPNVGARITEATMRYQLPDKRAIRGPFADVG